METTCYLMLTYDDGATGSRSSYLICEGIVRD